MKVYGGVWVGRVPDDPPHARQVRVIVAARSRAAVAEILRGLGEQVSVSYLASHWCETGNHEELAYGAAYPGEAIVTTMRGGRSPQRYRLTGREDPAIEWESRLVPLPQIEVGAP